MAAPVVFFDSDFCPFAQRFRIALEEKGISFDHRIVNIMNKDLPETKEFMAVNPTGTVPAAVHDGCKLYDSLLMNEYLEDAFPESRSLFPESPQGKFRVRQLITKHGNAVVGAFYTYLKVTAEAEADRKEQLSNVLLGHLAEMSQDLSEGPYFLGDFFSLADVAMFPFMERILALLPHFYSFSVPKTDAFASLERWYEACKEREGVSRTCQDRGVQSMRTLPFGAQGREDYLREVYEMYAKDDLVSAREVLASAPPGVRTLYA